LASLHHLASIHAATKLTSTAAAHPASTHAAVTDMAGNLLATYKNALANHALPTKMATGATLAVAGDAIAQSRVKEESYDVQRAASFAVFDMAYRALQHVAFPIITQYCTGQVFGSVASDAHAAAAMEQTLASQLGIVPFLYYPAFFALTGAVQGLSVDGAVQRAKENFVPLMKRNLLFWIPVQFVQFGFVQEDLQIPFLSVCGLGWTFILSVAAGSAKKYSVSHDDDSLAEEAMSVDLAAVSASDEVLDEAATQAVVTEEVESQEASSTRNGTTGRELASYKA
jgi:protein Mpv17